MAHFKELSICQKSVNFLTVVCKETESFPKNEVYGLISQIRRAAVSIFYNIYERNSRRSVPDYFLTPKI
ncbi:MULTISPECIES: four helix bundle protein [Chryseobacterium]|uniref:Four helix bundle protein n=1 Tax=Chryseobacterium taihuense TaxID=1141221 RepID=A0A4U8WB95_9FLAO|nr:MULTISPECIES: four helix bundle protein [Chryseobacterium]QQV03092.1 four helix bundle protein [Chryseobacterium sp. FDAARGOS 1104]VFB03611.1 four helix bundle protein [Chryseobacterium taihuense]